MAKVVQITAENFETEVAQASETRAVAVLFSSAEYPDCAPYSQLLGSLSTSMDFTLGVVSCDERENMQLIQAFRVRSVPEVHIVDKGQIADVIQGVLPEADLKKRLEKFFVSDEARFQAALEDAITQKNFDQALPMLDEALAKTPDDKKKRRRKFLPSSPKPTTSTAKQNRCWNFWTSTPKPPRKTFKVKKQSCTTKHASSPVAKISKVPCRHSSICT